MRVTPPYGTGTREDSSIAPDARRLLCIEPLVPVNFSGGFVFIRSTASTMSTVCGLWLLVIVRHASAQHEPPRQVSPTRPVTTPAAEIPPANPSLTRGLKDRAELEAFMDGIMTAQLRDH